MATLRDNGARGLQRLGRCVELLQPRPGTLAGVSVGAKMVWPASPTTKGFLQQEYRRISRSLDQKVDARNRHAVGLSASREPVQAPTIRGMIMNKRRAG